MYPVTEQYWCAPRVPSRADATDVSTALRSRLASVAHDLTGAICAATAALPDVLAIIASALELPLRAAAPATSNETARAAAVRRADLMLSMRVTPLVATCPGTPLRPTSAAARGQGPLASGLTHLPPARDRGGGPTCRPMKRPRIGRDGGSWGGTVQATAGPGAARLSRCARPPRR